MKRILTNIFRCTKRITNKQEGVVWIVWITCRNCGKTWPENTPTRTLKKHKCNKKELRNETK